MRANRLVGAHTSKMWRRGRPDAGGTPDLLNRQFHSTAPNQQWVAEVTEFPTGEGKLFLAAVLDLFHCGLAGWDTSARLAPGGTQTAELDTRRSPRDGPSRRPKPERRNARRSERNCSRCARRLELAEMVGRFTARGPTSCSTRPGTHSQYRYADWPPRRDQSPPVRKKRQSRSSSY